VGREVLDLLGIAGMLGVAYYTVSKESLSLTLAWPQRITDRTTGLSDSNL